MTDAVIRAADAGPTFSVLTLGDVDDEVVAYAEHKLAELHTLTDKPMVFGRLSLAHEADPARDRRAIAKISLDLNGELVRAHVAAHTMHEAVDLLVRRLRDKLEHRAERRTALRHRGPVSPPGTWRHGDLPAARPEYFARPRGERQLVRRKNFVAEEITPDEAAFDMEQLDFDFYLFRDLADHTDAMIERQDGCYRLTLAGDAVAERQPSAAPIEQAALPAPRMSLESAIERLDVSGERFLFFVEDAAGRGAVVYRRYDGHYGLIRLE
jgi:ribosome-associated translation inhibitor RaiA